MSFIQVIEYESDTPADMRALSERWIQAHPAEGPNRITVAEDREKPGHFVMVAEFPNYDMAMAYSKRPETSSYAEQMRQMARSEPRFVNLDVAYQEM